MVQGPLGLIGGREYGGLVAVFISLYMMHWLSHGNVWTNRSTKAAAIAAAYTGAGHSAWDPTVRGYRGRRDHSM